MEGKRHVLRQRTDINRVKSYLVIWRQGLGDTHSPWCRGRYVQGKPRGRCGLQSRESVKKTYSITPVTNLPVGMALQHQSARLPIAGAPERRLTRALPARVLQPGGRPHAGRCGRYQGAAPPSLPPIEVQHPNVYVLCGVCMVTKSLTGMDIADRPSVCC